MLSLLAIAIIAFVATNLDDLVVLTAFCGHEEYRLPEVTVGQYLGFGSLVVLSLIGGMTVARVLANHARLLGLLPIIVGIVWFVRSKANGSATRVGGGSTPRARTGLVAGIGITNGADNLAVYVPLFSLISTTDASLVVTIFMLAAGLWVLLAQWLSNRPTLADRLNKRGDEILPLVLMGLGLAILSGIV